jgi:pSer/pThr/pTyr-binding forkhead associated (FHA) protein
LLIVDEDENHVTAVPKGWSRIGRGASADLRLDDHTVSRRHAQLVNTSDGVWIGDDRSLNGVLVNGEPVDWAKLADGDVVEIGRYRLYLLSDEGV